MKDTLNTISTNRRYSGKVKWFNSKLGYGFITHVIDEKYRDIFVHWSNLLLNDKEFHTLYKGESVNFELEQCFCSNKVNFELEQYSSNKDVGIQACKVTGQNNGPLLTTLHGNYSINSQNLGRFSHIFQIRQLSIADFSDVQNLSEKALCIYSQNPKK
tara:strand:- start:381 stop:854 length:474 start_codon:yes stop_codon:yes gene_type:complete